MTPASNSPYSVGCFNVFGWEDALSVVQAAENFRAPVILSVNLDFRTFVPLDVIASMLLPLATRASVPICVHLDHTYDVETIFRAIDLGFTSVMYDGSQLSLDENIAGTKKVVQYAHRRGCSVEAEIGSVPYAEGRDHIKSALTDPKEAARLCVESGLDALAVSVGNVHRLTSPGATIDFGRLEEIERIVSVPLVIHGTSGILESDIRKLIGTRVSKFNIGTSLRQAFGRGLRAALDGRPDLFDRIEIMKQVMPIMSVEVERLICLLGWDSNNDNLCR